MIDRKCLECSKEFKAKPYEVKQGRAIFCSRLCQRRAAARSPKTPEGWRARSIAKRKGEWLYKDKARGQVQIALRNGKLIKPEECSICQLANKLDAHHDDYKKPLVVRWVCRPCHSRVHREGL